jgi:tetratricopeptide (TPR) repeat protein
MVTLQKPLLRRSHSAPGLAALPILAQDAVGPQEGTPIWVTVRARHKILTLRKDIVEQIPLVRAFLDPRYRPLQDALRRPFVDISPKTLQRLHDCLGGHIAPGLNSAQLAKLTDLMEECAVDPDKVQLEGHTVGVRYNLARYPFEQALRNAKTTKNSSLQAEAHYDLAQCHEALGEYGEARDQWRQGLAIEPSAKSEALGRLWEACHGETVSAVSCWALAEIFASRGDVIQAKHFAEKACTCEGLSAAENADWREAFAMAIGAKRPVPAEALIARGKQLRKDGHFTRALNCYVGAIQAILAPSNYFQLLAAGGQRLDVAGQIPRLSDALRAALHQWTKTLLLVPDYAACIEELPQALAALRQGLQVEGACNAEAAALHGFALLLADLRSLLCAAQGQIELLALAHSGATRTAQLWTKSLWRDGPEGGSFVASTARLTGLLAGTQSSYTQAEALRLLWYKKLVFLPHGPLRDNPDLLPTLAARAASENSSDVRMGASKFLRFLVSDACVVEALVKLLQSGGETQEGAALGLAHSLTVGAGVAAIPHVEAIPPLIASMNGNTETQKSAACVLAALSALHHEGVPLALLDAGAVRPLAAALQSDERDIKLSALRAVANLACACSTLKDALNAAGVIVPVVEALRADDMQTKQYAALAVANLASRNSTLKDALYAAGVLAPVVEALRADDMQTKQYAALAVANLASGNSTLKDALYAAGVLAPVVEALRADDMQTKQYAALAVANLACGSNTLRDALHAAGVSDPIVEALRADDMQTKQYAALTVANLASSSNTQRDALHAAGVLAPIAEALRADNARTKQYAAMAVAGLACGSSTQRDALHAAGVSAPIVEALRADNTGTKQYAARAVANLACGSSSRREALRASGAMEPLMELAHCTDPEIKRHATRAVQNLSGGFFRRALNLK